MNRIYFINENVYFIILFQFHFSYFYYPYLYTVIYLSQLSFVNNFCIKSTYFPNLNSLLSDVICDEAEIIKHIVSVLTSVKFLSKKLLLTVLPDIIQIYMNDVNILIIGKKFCITVVNRFLNSK